MEARIQKWGNSLGLRIPLQLAKHLNLQQGSPVILEVEGDRIVIQSPKYNLDEMVNQITPKNQHHQMLEDKPRGNEEW